jgi:hypothetical protein
VISKLAVSVLGPEAFVKTGKNFGFGDNSSLLEENCGKISFYNLFAKLSLWSKFENRSTKKHSLCHKTKYVYSSRFFRMEKVLLSH